LKILFGGKMKRFIDTLIEELNGFVNPMEAVSPSTSVPMTKEVEVKTDETHTVKMGHLTTQLERVKGELEAGLNAAKKHLEDGNLKLARLALESLEKLEEEIRALEVDSAKLKGEAAEENTEI
jgi:hypothetical protein